MESSAYLPEVHSDVTQLLAPSFQRVLHGFDVRVEHDLVLPQSLRHVHQLLVLKLLCSVQPGRHGSEDDALQEGRRVWHTNQRASHLFLHLHVDGLDLCLQRLNS
jgi:hypothetical protein